MLFLALVFLILALFLVTRVFRGYQAVWLSLVLFAFGCSLIGLAGLLPRFGNYRLEGWLSLPMEQPGWATDFLYRLSLYDFMRFRLWSIFAFIAGLMVFSLSYTTPERWRTAEKVTAIAVLFILGFLLWYYEPDHLFRLYREGAGLLTDPVARGRWENHLHQVDLIALGLIVITFLYALARIFWVIRTATIRQKKIQALCVGIGSAVLCLFALLLFCLGQASILNAHTMATTLLPLGPRYPFFDSAYFHAIPFAVSIAIGAMVLAVFRYGFLGAWRIGNGNLNQQIAIANQAVRMALHSFKNRFLAVQMALEMAVRNLEDVKTEAGERAHLQISRAREVCVEALTRLDVLHTQAKSLQFNPQWIPLGGICHDILSRYGNRLAGIKLVEQRPNYEIFVWGDPEHLTGIFENLIENALEAMSEIRREDYAPCLSLDIGQEYEWCYVRIADNGPGITKKNLARIFSPFFTTKPTKTNWGLGLTYCHRVIATHHGFINIRSTPGSITVFEVVLRCQKTRSSKKWQLLASKTSTYTATSL